MNQLSWITRVEGGKLTPKVSEAIAAAIRSLEGKRVELTLREAVKLRTPPQNRFYHGPFIGSYRDFLRSHGHQLTHDEVHSGLRDKYAKNDYTLYLPDGTPFRVPPSTARMSTIQIEDYMEEIRADTARYEWELPFPHEQY